MFKLVALNLLFTVFTAGSSAAAADQPSPQFTDTTELGTKDSLLLAVNQRPVDPKQGFRNIFTITPAATAVSMAQLNPLALGFVEDYMDKHSESLTEMKGWGKPYFDMMDEVLEKYDLPVELKYLAVIESQLKSQARSWAGAVGPWQFMAGTARMMGLKVNKYVDERRDMLKSTHAASKYLNSLYDQYGDWLLVIAAYNGGPGKVNSAIRRSGSRDFWVLQRYLPAESRNHVKKFIATHYMMEGVGGITTLTKKEASKLIAASEAVNEVIAADSTSSSVITSQAINGRYNSAIIVKHILMDIASFNKINPGFDRMIANEGKYQLRLPSDKMELFLTHKPAILAESLQLLLNPENTGQTATR